jgi:carboxypeptidase Q
MNMRFTLFILCAAILAAEERADLAVVNKIRAEAFQNSKIMETLFYLTDVNGPRVTNSTGFRSAADWAVGELKSYGLVNVNQEPWGKFGRSWNYSHYEGHMTEPAYSPLIGYPLAWTSGTDGMVKGDAIYAPMTTVADIEKYKGKLRGKIVLTAPSKDLQMSMTPQAHRLTDEELQQRMVFVPGSGRGGFVPIAPTGPPVNPVEQRRFRAALEAFLIAEKPAVTLIPTTTGSDGGTVFGTSGGSYKFGDPVPPPGVVLTPEHYDRIVRLLEHGIPVKLEFDIRAKFGDREEESFNIVGEIPGGSKKDEIVMIGGHFDSWHGATGATDNGTGSSVAIEAMRILKSLNVQMDRTVRIALWSGEEEGLLGSIAYVKNHFADRADMKTKPEYEKLVAYFNSDSGTGKFRGISVGGNDALMPIFSAWLRPFADLGATVVAGASAPPNGAPAGTDHTSFAYAGLNGFGFMQEPMEYGTRTHHSNMDFYDRVQKGDVMQSAAIMASFAYHTAMRAEALPKMPKPKAQAWVSR